MSDYENVVAGKLRLKGEALNVKGGGMKKRKKHKERHVPSSLAARHEQITDENIAALLSDGVTNEAERLTPAERRYLEQCQKIEIQRLTKTAKKSHRDRIQEFNRYLANLSEHYDIPKVGPG